MKLFRVFLFLLISVIAFGTPSAHAKPTTTEVYDAIIIPGYPFNPDGELNAIYKMRLYWAYKLYSTGVAKNIIVSGGAVHSPYVESQIFALYLKEMGVNPDHLVIEDQAKHSLENVFYSLQIAEERGFKKVAVATDLFQSGMIQLLGKRHKLKVDYIPANIRFVLSREWKSFDADIDYCLAFVDDFTPLNERLSRKERLNGTRGYSWMEANELSVSTVQQD